MQYNKTCIIPITVCKRGSQERRKGREKFVISLIYQQNVKISHQKYSHIF